MPSYASKNKKPTPRTRTSVPADEPVQTQELKFDKADGAPPVLPPIASPSANAGKVPEGIPGAIMRATVDRTNYLTYAIESDSFFVLRAGDHLDLHSFPTRRSSD